MSGNGNGSDRGPVPPYLAFATLKSFIATSKAHGLPNRIDASVLPNLSGTTRGQLLAALRFLDMIDHGGRPRPNLERLMADYETEEWPETLRAILEDKYASIVALNLQSATPSQFSSTFNSNFSGEGETARKGMTFFLNAALEAKMPVSPYIMKNKKPRVGASRARKRQASKAGAEPITNTVPLAGSSHTEGALHVSGSHGSARRHLPMLVKALVDMLPQEGEQWTLEAAQDWLQTAAYNFRYAYKLPGILEIEIKPVAKA